MFDLFIITYLTLTSIIFGVIGTALILANVKRVGGLSFIRIGRLSISFSIAKQPLSQREKESRKAWRKEAREELHYNAKIGRRVRFEHLRGLANRRLARLDRELTNGEWTPDDWTVGIEH